ncbi:MAG: hypothetical protein F4Z31_04510 [Gemmatimonadetes bacterium]|nr:hypothetical protein [Gemmatimonadota bacterium]MYF07762.1 hypothetical protein [Rhodospirillaceae bacterium]
MKLEGRPVKALAICGVIVVVVLILALIARCSDPSTLNDAPPPSGPTGADAVGAAAAAESSVSQWAGEQASTAALVWLDDNTAVVTISVDGGEFVDTTVSRSPEGWDVAMPPQPSPGPPEGRPSPVYDQVPPGAQTDDRWLTAVGFLEAWLGDESTSRWTLTTYRPEPPAELFAEWRVVGGSAPVSAPGSQGAVQVFALDFEGVTAHRHELAASGDVDSIGGEVARPYRVWLSLMLDQTGRWAVSQVSHRPPPTR